MTDTNEQKMIKILERFTEELYDTDPVKFIEENIKVAGFPLILNTKTEHFVNRLHSEDEITTHDFLRGEGKSTGIQAYLLSEAVRIKHRYTFLYDHTSSQAYHALRFMRVMYDTIPASEKPAITEWTNTYARFDNGSRITVSGPNFDNLTGVLPKRIVIENFGRMTEQTQAQFALKHLPRIQASNTKIAIL